MFISDLSYLETATQSSTIAGASSGFRINFAGITTQLNVSNLTQAAIPTAVGIGFANFTPAVASNNAEVDQRNSFEQEIED